MMKPGAVIVGLALLLSSSPACAADAPSVAVQTIAAKRASLADTITAYGTAAPVIDGSTTLSLPSDGRVLQLAVAPGQMVQPGQRLLDFAFLAATISAYQQALTALNLARSQRQHTAALLAQQLATRDQLAQAEKAVADAQITLDAMRQEGRDKPVQIVTAPFAGIVTAIPVAQGSQVAAGTPLITMARGDALAVIVGIEPSGGHPVRPGQPARLEPLSGTGAAIDGTVVRVDGMLNAKTRLIDTTISAPAGLVLGAAFRAVITVGQFDGWLVPRNAVLSDGQGAYLFQVSGGNAARVNVKIVGSVGDTTVVDGRLAPQLPIVIQGNYQLSDGMPVRAASAGQ
jgi:membrane fusion protein (multidrug efflux system)